VEALVLARIILLIAAFFFWALSLDRAFAEKRVALVIGNSTYKSVPKLINPENDATAIGLLFKKAGFDAVDVRQNLNNGDMRRAMRDFSESIKDADIAVVFFAGHGLEVSGTNFLVPVDSTLKRDIDVEDEAVSLDRVLTLLEPAKKLRLVILDACRDNPFLPTMARTLASRSVGRGLAKIETPGSDTLVAYAAKAGAVAADGEGTNSPFTLALLRHLTTPGLDVRLAFGRIRDEVLSTTNKRQEPFVYGALGGATVTLAALSTEDRDEQKVLPAADADVQASRDYEFAAKVGTKEAWESFLKKHPKGFYADLATAQRNKLIDPVASLGPKPGEPVEVQPTFPKKQIKAAKLVVDSPAESTATLRRKYIRSCTALGNSAADCAHVCESAGAACLRTAFKWMRTH
jgi:uncharacterized caspase-like protein